MTQTTDQFWPWGHMFHIMDNEHDEQPSIHPSIPYLYPLQSYTLSRELRRSLLPQQIPFCVFILSNNSFYHMDLTTQRCSMQLQYGLLSPANEHQSCISLVFTLTTTLWEAACSSYLSRDKYKLTEITIFVHGKMAMYPQPSLAYQPNFVPIGRFYVTHQKQGQMNTHH